MKQVQISEFEPTSSGQMAHFYRIENASGASVTLCDYGASIVSLLVPDRQKLLRDRGAEGEITHVCYEPVTGAHVGPGTVALFFYGKAWR